MATLALSCLTTTALVTTPDDVSTIASVSFTLSGVAEVEAVAVIADADCLTAEPEDAVDA